MDVTGTDRVESIAQACTDVLRHRPSALFSDFDGTLSAIAPTPDDAAPYEGALEAFARIVRAVDMAGFITGRAVADVLTKMPVDGVMAVGNHGLEWYLDGEHIDHPAGVAAEDGVRNALAEIDQRIAAEMSNEGLIFENKRLTGSVHYRNVADPIEMAMVLGPIVDEVAVANGLRVVGGKMIYELRPQEQLSKGTAIEQLVRERGMQGAIFFGDDLSDVDGFRVLHTLRDEEGIATLAVGIRTADIHPEVLAEADMVVNHVSETVAVLHRIADLLEEGDA